MSRSTCIYLITQGYSNDPVGAFTVKHEAQDGLRAFMQADPRASYLVVVFRHGWPHKELSPQEFLKS